MQVTGPDAPSVLRWLWSTFVGRCLHRFLAMAGFDRSIVLASQAFTALIPLLILLSTHAPSEHDDAVTGAVIARFGLTGSSAVSVEQLFEVPGDSTGSVSVLSALLLLFSGVSFMRRMQGMYQSAWDRRSVGVRNNLFAALGFSAIVAELVLLYSVHSLLRRLPVDWLLTVPVSAAVGLVLWTSIPYLLLNREVHWRRLLFGGGVNATTTALYSVATGIYMPRLVDKYTTEFGLFGITIAIVGWLLAISVVLVASAAIGAEFDASQAPWARAVRRRLRLVDPGDPEDAVRSSHRDEVSPSTRAKPGTGNHPRRGRT